MPTPVSLNIFGSWNSAQHHHRTRANTMKKHFFTLIVCLVAGAAFAETPTLNTAPFMELLSRIGNVATQGNLADPQYVGTALKCQIAERHVPATKVGETELPAVDYGYLLSNCPQPQAAHRSFLYTNTGKENTQPGKVVVSLSPFDDTARLPLQKVFDLATTQFGTPQCEGDEYSAQYCIFQLKGEHKARLVILGMHGVLINIALQN